MTVHSESVATQESKFVPTDLTTVPWCANLLSDPAFSLVAIDPWAPKPNEEDTFFGRTLATESTVVSCVSQQRKPTGTSESEFPIFPAIHEVRTFFLLGDGVNGHSHVAHGGFIAAILDETMGLLLHVNKDSEELRAKENGQKWERFATMTASLNLRFRKPLPTPGAVLVRAWVDRIEGRKHFISGVVEDGSGGVYTEADALFISLQKKNVSL